MCVYVCVRERERERESKIPNICDEKEQSVCVFVCVYVCLCVCVCACVCDKKEIVYECMCV